MTCKKKKKVRRFLPYSTVSTEIKSDIVTEFKNKITLHPDPLLSTIQYKRIKSLYFNFFEFFHHSIDSSLCIEYFARSSDQQS